MTTSESKGRFFLQNESIRIESIIIIIINQRRGGVEQRLTALGNPPHHLEVHKRTKTLSKVEGYRNWRAFAGRNAAQRRPAYECVNRHIKNIVLDYQNRDSIDYLRVLAHNIMHWILPLTFK